MPELTTKNSDLSEKIISSLERLQGRGAWKRRLLQLKEKYGADAYRSVFYILAHLDFAPRRAKNHWQKVLDVWEELDRRTGSRLDLRVVVVHYFLKVQKKLRNQAIVEIKFLQQAEDSVRSWTSSLGATTSAASSTGSSGCVATTAACRS